MAVWRSVVAMSAAGLALAGCRVFEESLLREDDAGAVVRDAGPDAGHDAGAPPLDAGPACELRHPPPRPATPDDGSSTEELIYALREIFVDQGESWATTGYDVDGLCSIGASPDVECVPPAASATPEIDGEGGIDNVLGHQILPLILLEMPDLPVWSVGDMTKGIGAPVIRIRGWNGEPDDARVDAVFAQSVFATPGLPDGGLPDPEIPDGGIVYYDGGSIPPEPNWDGNDYWWVRPEFFQDDDPERPFIRDDNAYVAGNVLVMRLPGRVPLIFSGPERALVVRLTDAVMTLQISDDRTLASAILAGRWSVADATADIVHARVCMDSMTYRTFRRVLDLTADVRAVPGTGGEGALCDAVSIGTRFEGSRAKLGGVSALFDLPTPCDDLDAGAPDGG